MSTSRCYASAFAISLFVLAVDPLPAGQGRVQEAASLYGEVVDLRTELRNLGDPQVTAVSLSFKLKIRNGQAQAVKLGDSTYLTSLAQFRKRGTPDWRPLTRHSLVYNDTLPCSDCTTLPSGAVRLVDRVQSQITTLRQLWPDPAEVEFRLVFEAVCRQGAQLHPEVFATLPFRLDVKLPPKAF